MTDQHREIYSFIQGILGSYPFVIDSENARVGVGTTSPLGKLHVRSANAGSFTYDTAADDFIVESNANGGMTIATAAANTGRIIFASPDDPTGAEISFSQTGNLMKVGPTTGSSDLVLQAASGTEFLRLDAGEDQGKFRKHMRFDDDVQARFGTHTDASIRHDDSDWFLQCGKGDFYIQNLADGRSTYLRSDDGSGGVATYLTIDGGREEVVANKPLVQTPASSSDDPTNNGELIFTVASNTSIKVKYKGTDGQVRSTSLTLS